MARTTVSSSGPRRTSGRQHPRKARSERGLTRLELSFAAAAAGLALLGFGGWKVYAAEVGGEEAALQRGQIVLTAAADWKREHLEQGCPSITQLQRASLLDEKARAEDPWGQRYRIRCTEEEVQVLSAGKDGRFQTPDDITLAKQPNS